MSELEDAIEERKQRKLEQERKARELEEKIARDREEARRIKKFKKEARRRRIIPPVVMLTAGAIISIAMIVLRFSLRRMLPVLLGVLICFYIIGELLKWMLDRFAKQNEEIAAMEGAVIEKQQQEEDNTVG